MIMESYLRVSNQICVPNGQKCLNNTLKTSQNICSKGLLNLRKKMNFHVFITKFPLE